MKYQGVIWEKGTLAGRIILFPVNSGICIGTDAREGPDILIEDKRGGFYFCVSGAREGNPHEYMVLWDFDGPFRPAHSGDVFEFGSQKFRLI